MKEYKHIFGPVPSRRLGRSLGIDPVPPKTCSFDCIYCQLGKTTNQSVLLKEYIPVEDILEELKEKLGEIDPPDYITITGSGEPTLHSRLGDMIAGIKQITAIPVAVITNGSLLWMPEVRRALQSADVVLPSLDAGDDASFQRVNRPHSALTFSKMVDGLIQFRKEYAGQIWLEIFLVGGITDSEEEARKIAALVEKIKPDKVQLNTTTRPAGEGEARAVPQERLKQLAHIIGYRAEVIADYQRSYKLSRSFVRAPEVLAVIARHPCSLDDIAEGLGISLDQAAKNVDELLRSGAIIPEKVGERIFYKAANQSI